MRVRSWILVAALVAGAPSRAAGQFLSPGRLAEAHREIEGLRNCASCHQLGRSGVSAARCLECHEAVGGRIRDGEGFHATVASDDCASCHQDHLGADFELVRFDEEGFDHASVGYTLELSHAEVGCRDCHTAPHVSDPLVRSLKGERNALDRTYLGLDRACAGCHGAESPHGEQFGARTCDACHDSGLWERPGGFDHAQTSFPLQGLHREIDCSECHGSGEGARYTPLPHLSCSDCHSDPHAGSMEGACAGCHREEGWHSVRGGSVEGRFDHTRTAFPLHGSHAQADCVACHRTGRPPRSELTRIAYVQGTTSRTYPLPIADSCASCHVDRHAGPGSPGRWTGCADCHGDAEWRPSAFGFVQHAETVFPLTGAHLTTPCVGCHVSTAPGAAFPLAVVGRECADCHDNGEGHEGRYDGIACTSCHGTDAFDLVEFDHAELQGSPDGCGSCHADRDPHQSQFPESDCASCHGTESFDIPAFDHSGTAFPLDGAHETTECSECHRTESGGGVPFVRYRPLGAECVDCHGGDV